MNNSQLSGMRGFALVAGGQFISLVGSAMTQFAVGIWAWEKTGQATALALAQFFSLVPLILLSPVAGALVDRWNRKLTMMLSDLGTGAMTIMIFVLYNADTLEIWHIYLAVVVAGAFQVFQWPAFSAAISLMVPKQQYARANALIGLAETSSFIIAPSLAGALLAGVAIGALVLPSIGMAGILAIDIFTFTFAIGALLIVYVPQPTMSEAGKQSKGSLWKESIYGFRFILQRPSLLGLQLVFMFGNLFATAGFAVMTPMILSRTGSDAQLLGAVQSVAGIGGVVGGLILSAWGGPKRRVHGVLLGWLVSALGGMLLLGVGRGLVVWVVGGFIAHLTIPFVNGSNQAIWQAKVQPDLQGRVFAARRMIAWLINPLATLAVGPLADQVLEPAMREGGALAGALGWLVGTGPGAGMALIMVISALGAAVVAIFGYFVPVIRNAEDLLPDHDAAPAPEPALAPVPQVEAGQA